jgi:hypothetical protein
LKRIHNWELQDDLDIEKGQSRKKSRTEVIIDDGLEEGAQPETRTLTKIQKEVVYSIDTLPSIFIKTLEEGSTNIKTQSVYAKYDDMRNMNEQIKNIWSQKLNQGSPDTILLSGFDFEKGRFNLEILV